MFTPILRWGSTCPKQFVFSCVNVSDVAQCICWQMVALPAQLV
ncbi:hypothetical protein GMES_3903 [Paraglaciecola mesophila KMM 241]|uniref:Uncharacterized protein n=1 Tax=Paraglaciecola mesophila KMM 241 TaxID=1128912 RepID=K6YQ99_9ALTE|nr:hypothetical protein GMES_3903 [Paraglaciecola mesophila KMM 241]